MRTFLGLVAGVATQALFAFTVWHLFHFLRGDVGGGKTGSLWIDAVLSLSFGVVHSTLLYPTVREFLTRWIAAPFYGLFYCVITCVGLLAVFAMWSTSPSVWWEFTGPALVLVRGAWYGSWIWLIYSLWLSGFGYQTGATPWWRWLRRRPSSPRPFHPRGAFLWIRHPVYLGFLGLVWCVPVMTPDRAILIASWTLYILIGSWLKDGRLLWYIGQPYRVYMSQVVGYPGISAGPLAKRPFEPGEKVGDAIAAPVSALPAALEPVERQTLVAASMLTREPD